MPVRGKARHRLLLSRAIMDALPASLCERPQAGPAPHVGRPGWEALWHTMFVLAIFVLTTAFPAGCTYILTYR